MRYFIARANIRAWNKKRAATRRIFRHVRGLRLGQADYQYNIKSRRQRRYVRKRYR